MLISKRKAIIMCVLVIMISVVQFLKNKLSCPSSHHLSLFPEVVILIHDVFRT